jgi:hypothetical protein
MAVAANVTMAAIKSMLFQVFILEPFVGPNCFRLIALARRGAGVNWWSIGKGYAAMYHYFKHYEKEDQSRAQPELRPFAHECYLLLFIVVIKSKQRSHVPEINSGSRSHVV